MNIPDLFSLRKINHRLFWFFFGLATAGFILGYIGFYQLALLHYKNIKPAGQFGWLEIDFNRFLTPLYHSIQMFILHTPHLEEPVPFSLELGRLLVALGVFGTAIYFLFLYFYKNWLTLSIFRYKQHAVFCGLGKLGLPLALEAKERKMKPVIIEKDPEKKEIYEAVRNRIPVVIGDATQEDMLRKAHLERAAELYALCKDDDTNLKITAMVKKIKNDFPLSQLLNCWVFINNHRLRAACQRNEEQFQKEGKTCRINFRGLDVYPVIAREVFKNLPLNHLSLHQQTQKRPKLILIGFEQVGRDLALQAAKITHFPSEGKLILYVVDQQAAENVRGFKAVYPNFDKAADIEIIPGTPEDEDVQRELEKIYKQAQADQDLLACVVCHDTDFNRNLALSLDILKITPEGKAPILVYAKRDSGISQLVSGWDTDVSEYRIRSFGTMESIWTFQTLKDEAQDVLAKEIHQGYCRGLEERRRNKEIIEEKPAEKPWEELEEIYRNSNRAQADHIPVKLHAVGLKMIKSVGANDCEIPQLDNSQIEMLSRMEHNRWCAERWLGGWSYGPKRDDANKIHKDLVPWDKLPESEKNIDRNMMINIYSLLKNAGYRVIGN